LDAADRAKGIDYLIAAMGAIVQEIPAARLRVVGSGDDLARLQALSHEHRVSHAVKFLGQLNDEDLKRELDACRLFALPSQQEGFGLVYLEAMARGKPCLAMRESGAREIVAPETGVLADQVSAPLIATACVEALRRVWDAPAIARHAQKFSYPQIGSRLAQAIPLPA
jgi:glycosyltransferase involved in cell wall biosynthesis